MLTRSSSFFTLACIAACAEEESPRIQAAVQYRWDGSRVLCSKVIDDVAHDGLTKVGAELIYAAANDTAALMHAHVPVSTVSREQMNCTLELANRMGVDLVTFSELAVHANPRPALALSFDDEAIDAWYEARDLFANWGARVTFFVAGYATWTGEQRVKLAELAALGHDVQAHSMYHLNAVEFVAEHGIAEYLQREVLPSIAMLEQAGHPITTYAYPYGATTDDINDAVLEHVPQVRVTRSECPFD